MRALKERNRCEGSESSLVAHAWQNLFKKSFMIKMVPYDVHMTFSGYGGTSHVVWFPGKREFPSRTPDVC